MAREKASEDLAGTVRANMEGLTKIQKEFGGAFEETSRYWSDRAKSEAEFASDLVAKLSGARSIPDATTVYQEWLGRRMERLAEDSQKFAADCQKLTTEWTKLVTGETWKGTT
jgi:hypothetical protein